MTSAVPGPMRFESLFFDFDGTLVDSLPGIEFSIQQAFARCGQTMPPVELRTMIGPSVRSILQKLAGNASSSEVDRLESAFRASYDTAGWAKTPVFSGVAETLQRLTETGVRLFIFTNKPATVTRQIVEHLKMESLFQEILSRSSRTPPYASKAEMLADLLQRHHASPMQSAVVGDSSEDFEAASGNKLPFFFASYGYGKLAPTDLQQRTTVISNFSDLMTHCSGAV